MQKRLLLMAALITLLFLPLASGVQAAPPATPAKAAFIRDDTLWLSENGKEVQLTTTKGAQFPQWSFDGRWISYEQPDGIWVYDTQERRASRVYQQHGTMARWAPDKNVLALLDAPVLNTVDLRQGRPKPFENVALGVSTYSWLPDGTGFLASANADLLPDGWTSPKLYTIAFNQKQSDLFKNAKLFYTIPQPLTLGSINLLSIHTSPFKWSRDGQWIAFIVSPTASWSMDSNLLCVLSADGKSFSTVAEMLADPQWFQWAPNRSDLGYIRGGDRLVAGFSNKKLTITQLPQKKTTDLTPPSFIELDFDWYSDDILATSRAKEGEFSNDPAKRPHPALYQVNVKTNQQKALTTPPAGYGDYQPHYLKKTGKLTWIRTSLRDYDSWLSHSTPKTSDVWMADADGRSQRLLIKHVQQISWYEGRP
ncbi:TolB domain-containing protein [Brevibacillus fluminis]|uniref:TolB domain-containing protein n=1 Tax=Brevibacillus fluminis TaxID=511487 RepID=A0A3M8DRI5_9BACL|nr:TolB domain-containing protein [Brevibacillus fluminis]RNB90662.1 TolB domain-containing protein [Brevibacillus fluminis]